MKKIYILIILFTSYTIARAQEKDSIIYIFPDKVEKLLYEYVKTHDKNSNFEFRLETKGENIYTIFVHISDNYWGQNTNRFIVINDKKYPLTFDYDSLFSTNKKDDIGKFGQRDDGYVMRTVFIIEGYNITFDKYGFDVKESWGIYKKITDE